MEGYPGNTGCNSDAFIGQVGATVMHTQAASGLLKNKARNPEVSPSGVSKGSTVWGCFSTNACICYILNALEGEFV